MICYISVLLSFDRLRACRWAKVLGKWVEGYNVYQNRTNIIAKSTKDGTSLVQRGGQGVSGNQQKYEKVKKNANGKNQNKKNMLFFEMWGDFLKSEGSEALRLLRYFEKGDKHAI